MHTHKQTDKLFERGEIESTLLGDSGTTHIANLTLNSFPCVVIILFQFQLSVSRTADNKTRKYRTKNLIVKNQMNISNTPLFYDILIQAFLFPPATGPAWNAWWSWSAWICWREGQDLFISNYTACVGSCACVCVCVFILLNVTSLSGWGWRSWRPWDSWRAWHCCESRCLHLPFLSCSTLSFLRCLSSPFHQLSFHMCSRVLTAIWGRRVTLALPEQLGLQDPEEHQGRMDPKATLWVSLNQWLFLVNVMQCGWWFLTHWFYHRAPLDSLEIQDPLENLASMWVFLLLLLFYYSWIVG